MKAKVMFFRVTTLSAALAAAWPVFGALPGATDEAIGYMTPVSEIVFGATLPTERSTRFGMYSGMRDNRVYGDLGLKYVRRDEDGRWIEANVRNLLLESRELDFSHQKQGEWKYSLGYSATPRYSQYIVNTGLQGIGTGQVNVSPTNKQDVQLKTLRQGVTLGGSYQISDSVDVTLRFKNEEKQGARLFGRGTPGGTNRQFLAEPLDTNTRQIDMAVGYVGDGLQLQGGYYGSFFNQRIPGLVVTQDAATANTSLASFSPIALPPSSDSHQLFVIGGYDFSKTLRASGKLSYTRATQQENFVAPPGGGTTRANLDGQLDTTLLQAGLSARPADRLSLVATLRYEDRNDKTPIEQYIAAPNPTGTSTATYDGKNEPRSRTQTTGKVDASYSLPDTTRLSAGLEYDTVERNTSVYRSVTHRDRVDETSLRLSASRSLADTLSGSLGYVYSDRGGSDFATNIAIGVGPADVVGSNLVAPIYIADRERQKLRLTLDWAPTDSFGLQALVEASDDKYDPRNPGAVSYGVEDGSGSFVSLDATFAITDEWKVNGWVSRGVTEINQRTTGSGAIWTAKLEQEGDSVGLGFSGEIGGTFLVGGSAQYDSDVAKNDAVAVSGTAFAPLPEYYTETVSLRLWSEYALDKNSGVRVDLGHQRWRTTDWTWLNPLYDAASDGTTVRQANDEKVSFVGVSYRYRWQ